MLPWCAGYASLLIRGAGNDVFQSALDEELHRLGLTRDSFPRGLSLDDEEDMEALEQDHDDETALHVSTVRLGWLLH